jgi:hypothetical protein
VTQLALIDADGALTREALAFTKPLRFDGADYVRGRDDERLTGQLKRIYECMKDAHWRTLRTMAAITRDPEPSISAQLRHLRKKRFGSHVVNRRYVADGLYEYQLIVNTGQEDNA